MKLRLMILTLIFFGIALASRIWMVAMAPHSLCFSVEHMHPDQCVILLMGKHILQQGELPIFYYGQDWFGSVEAFVHASFFWIFGITDWSIHFAPLLFYMGFCLFVFLLARDLFGIPAGLWALLWCAFSPIKLSEYSVMPHGGYIDAPMFGTMLLWVAVRTVKAKTGKGKIWGYVSMGIIGGLGWWASPMMIYYLLTTAVFILIRERVQGMIKGGLITIPAFFVGSFPFFYYYAKDPFSEVLGMGGGYALRNLKQGVVLFFRDRLPGFLDLNLFNDLHRVFFLLGLLIYSGVIVFFFWLFRKEIMNLFVFKQWIKISDASILWLLFGVVFAVLTTSVHIRRGATQYLIPLTTFLSIAIGVFATQFFRRFRYVAAVLVLILLMLQMRVTWGWVSSQAPRCEAKAEKIHKVIREMTDLGVDRVYTDWLNPGAEYINFYSDEKIIASRTLQERYTLNFNALENTDHPAFLNFDDRLHTQLGIMGGASRVENLEKYQLYHQFFEPQRRYHQIDVGHMKGTASDHGEMMANVFDRDAGTVWDSREKRKNGMWAEFDLGKVYDLGLVRLWNEGKDHGFYALDTSVEVSLDAREWKEVIRRNKGDLYYWSGPRIYYWEWGYRWEARFGPERARYVRIKQYENSKHSSWKISEAYFYEDMGAPKGSGHEGEKDVIDRIKELGLERVYADRWMSAKVAQTFGDRIETVEPFTFSRSVYYPRFKSRIVEWGKKTGFILEDSDADQFDEMMEKEGIGLRFEKYGRWELFYFKDWGKREEALTAHEGWWWMGLGVVEVNKKSESRYLKEIAVLEEEAGDLEAARNDCKRALEVYENNTGAHERLIEILKKEGKVEEARLEEKALEEKTQPKVKCYVEFDHGVDFIGYTMDQESLKAGKAVKVKYYWKLKANPGEGVAAFVHVEGGGNLLYGDHNFLSGQRNIWPALEGEVFLEEEVLKIPMDSPAGEYQIKIGLFNTKTGKRWKIKKAPLPTNDRSVQIGDVEIQG